MTLSTFRRLVSGTGTGTAVTPADTSGYCLWIELAQSSLRRLSRRARIVSPSVALINNV
jgi:hypothetical protein